MKQIQVTPTPPRVNSSLCEAEDQHAFCDELTVTGVRYAGDAAGSEGGYAIGISASEFSAARIVGALSRSTFDNCVFVSSDLSNLRADETSFLESRVTQCRLTGLSLSDGVLRDVLIDETRADLASFRGCRIQRTVFVGSNLSGADFQRAVLRNVRFEGCDLTGAQFSQARMEHNVSLVDCRLIDIRGVAGLKGARVRGDDLLGLAGSLAREVGIDVEW
ncbi:pentapeptide repeat-containing protein [Nocardia sp. NPDC057353]|uniref:pentapeptide repeat-containing protein n=1 Tax=Nocardia sp. NPDC057353 TaxID=3346104 RepID=UPI003636457A